MFVDHSFPVDSPVDAGLFRFVLLVAFISLFGFIGFSPPTPAPLKEDEFWFKKPGEPFPFAPVLPAGWPDVLDHLLVSITPTDGSKLFLFF